MTIFKTMETVPARILIIDDEVFIRKSVREILLDQGYFVKEAGNSEQGFELLNKESFDLVLLDIQMPGMDGMDTLKKMFRENYETEVIMISGHGSIETAVEAIKFGAHAFLQKPFSMAKLKSSVNSLLAME
ncbi:MAG: response regulator [bacterium]